jgi:hypothetical protein
MPGEDAKLTSCSGSSSGSSSGSGSSCSAVVQVVRAVGNPSAVASMGCAPLRRWRPILMGSTSSPRRTPKRVSFERASYVTVPANL